jgi:small subunit ribosomal protein S14
LLKNTLKNGQGLKLKVIMSVQQTYPETQIPIRLHNRCKLTGRPKGYMRQFGISRITFREMASSGLIPGVKKASW